MSTKKKGNAEKFLESMVGELTLGKVICSIRECDEYSQIHFAKMLGISPSHLCDIEKGRKVVAPERAAKFARILGYSEMQFVRLSLQGMLDAAGMKLSVKIEAA